MRKMSERRAVRSGLDSPLVSRRPLIVGQRIELWRGALAAALRGRREAPLREAAARQFEADADG